MFVVVLVLSANDKTTRSGKENIARVLSLAGIIHPDFRIQAIFNVTAHSNGDNAISLFLYSHDGASLPYCKSKRFLQHPKT